MMAALLATIISLFSKGTNVPLKAESSTNISNATADVNNYHHVIIGETVLHNFRNVFVIGDVHGCYDELMELLLKAKAIGDHTLKVFVGDMLCKGPKNLQVLRELRKMKHVAVRGNHEEAVVRELKYSRETPEYNLKEKYAWLKNLTFDEQAYIENLPYTISFPSIGSVIVHAGLLPGKSISSQSTNDMVRMRNIIANDYFDGGLEASDKAVKGTAWAEHWAGPSHVYFGHDAKRGLQKFEFATGLDTGCVYGKNLTGVFIHGPWKGEFISVKAREVYVNVN